MPLICPTCQNVFAGIAQSIHASDHHATLHGVVFDILVGSVHRVGLAAVIPDDDRRMACRAVAREPSSLSRREGFGFQSVFAFASLKLRRTPRFALQAPRGRATRSPKGEAWWARQDSNLQPDRYEREDKEWFR